MISVLIAQKFRKFDLADIPQAYALTVLYALVVGIIAWLISRTKREAV
jgi:ABC-type spermidine/putrescine transport system permease subunit I